MVTFKQIKQFYKNRPWIGKSMGGFLIFIGLTALVTPFTPGSWLALIGLEMIGVRHSVFDRLKDRLHSKKKR
jgi:hypothetical protein